MAFLPIALPSIFLLQRSEGSIFLNSSSSNPRNIEVTDSRFENSFIWILKKKKSKI